MQAIASYDGFTRTKIIDLAPHQLNDELFKALPARCGKSFGFAKQFIRQVECDLHLVLQSARPVFDLEPGDVFEMPSVVRYQHHRLGQRMGGNLGVHIADGLAADFLRGA